MLLIDEINHLPKSGVLDRLAYSLADRFRTVLRLQGSYGLWPAQQNL